MSWLSLSLRYVLIFGCNLLVLREMVLINRVYSFSRKFKTKSNLRGVLRGTAEACQSCNHHGTAWSIPRCEGVWSPPHLPRLLLPLRLDKKHSKITAYELQLFKTKRNAMDNLKRNIPDMGNKCFTMTLGFHQSLHFPDLKLPHTQRRQRSISCVY